MLLHFSQVSGSPFFIPLASNVLYLGVRKSYLLQEPTHCGLTSLSSCKGVKGLGKFPGGRSQATPKATP